MTEPTKKVWILVFSGEDMFEIYGVYSTLLGASVAKDYYNRPSATYKERHIWFNLEIEEHEVVG